MKKDKRSQNVGFSKVFSITLLALIAIFLILMGSIITLLSLVNDVYFPIMGSSIHGSVWGIVITFLGIRYVMSVMKLKQRVYQSSSKFSIRNFKRKVTA